MGTTSVVVARPHTCSSFQRSIESRRSSTSCHSRINEAIERVRTRNALMGLVLETARRIEPQGLAGACRMARMGHYPSRRAVVGSIVSTRRAGSTHASNPTTSIIADVRIRAFSTNDIPASPPPIHTTDRMKRFPATMPPPTRRTAREKIPTSSRPVLAPRADRNPISRVRRATVTDISEKIPAADRNNPSATTPASADAETTAGSRYATSNHRAAASLRAASPDQRSTQWRERARRRSPDRCRHECPWSAATSCAAAPREIRTALHPDPWGRPDVAHHADDLQPLLGRRRVRDRVSNAPAHGTRAIRETPRERFIHDHASRAGRKSPSVKPRPATIGRSKAAKNVGATVEVHRLGIGIGSDPAAASNPPDVRRLHAWKLFGERDGADAGFLRESPFELGVGVIRSHREAGVRFASRHVLIETEAHGEVPCPGNCARIRRSRQASSPMPMAGGIQITVTATCAIIAVVHTPPKRSVDPAPRLRSCACTLMPVALIAGSTRGSPHR